MGWSHLAMVLLGVGLGVSGSALIRPWRKANSTDLSDSSAHPIADTQPTPTQAQLQQELQQAQLDCRMTQQISQFKAGFLARTSHELRSPLNGAIGMHQLILADLCDSPEEEREFLQQAHASVLKMLGLLDELITVSKVESGSAPPKLQPVSMAEVFTEVKQLTHLLAANRNLRLDIQHPEDDLKVMADPIWLKQVLLSLVETPIALMEEGTIRLLVHPVPDSAFAHIWIEDQRPAETWQEALDLLKPDTPLPAKPALEQRALESPARPSMGLSLILNQMVLQAMGGHLDLLATPSTQTLEDAESLNRSAEARMTRLQCRLPLA